MTLARWVVGALKGGTGKTLTAVGLALGLHDVTQVDVLLIDADGGTDMASQLRRIGGDRWPDGVRVRRATHPLDVERLIREDGTRRHVVIDTGPHDAAALAGLLASPEVERLVMPLKPTTQDMLRVQPTIDVAAEGNKRRPQSAPRLGLTVVFNQVDARTRASVDARAAIEDRGMQVARTSIPVRASVADLRWLHSSTTTTTPTPEHTDLVRDLLMEDREK